MRSISLIIFLLWTTALKAQLKEFKVDTLTRPEVAVVQANTQFPDDALILVYSSLRELNFRSSLGKIDKVSFNTIANRYEILVSPVKQMLFVYAPSFIELKLTTLNPSPKDVFYFKVEEKKDIQPVQSEPGILQINTTPPGADIFLNGIQIIDKTPFNGAATAGTTRIKLRKKKYAEFDTTITIESQKTTAVSHVFKSTYLYLSINSNPVGASVVLDGVELGKTPLNKEIDLSDLNKQSLKTLRMQLEGYEEIEDPITYSPSNKPLELNYELKKSKGSFLITSVPEGASVYIDGAFKGLTPFSGSRELGTFEVKLELDGYMPSEKKQLVLTQNGNNQVAFTLRPLLSPDEEAEITSQAIKEVRIGNQVWMTENLNTDRFRNGELIRYADTDEEWFDAYFNEQPAWCYYKKKVLIKFNVKETDADTLEVESEYEMVEPENSYRLGKLYNWYAVADARGLCPVGWHVPSDAEWTVLIDAIGGEELAGEKMKSTSGWDMDYNGNNSSGFSGIPSGYRLSISEDFDLELGESANWWSSTEDHTNSNFAWTRRLFQFSKEALRIITIKEEGLSVRCLKD